MHLSLTKHLITQRASWIERSASSRTSRFTPRTKIETVLPGFATPVILTKLIFYYFDLKGKIR